MKAQTGLRELTVSSVRPIKSVPFTDIGPVKPVPFTDIGPVKPVPFTDIGPVKQKLAIIFLPISLNMCFGCSKEPSH